MNIKIKVSDKFKPLYHLPPDTNLVILMGGRGGMKTYEASKFSCVAATIKNKRVAIMRDEKETIKESILHEIFERYDTANKMGHFDDLYEKSDNGLRDKKSGRMLIFTKGFRASSLDKKTNLKGISDTDIALIEEAEDIRSFEKFSTFKDSIRTEGRLIIILLNTPDIQHWIIERYFNLEQVEDGYWKCIPKKIKGFFCIQSNYKDNPYLPLDVIRDYESYGDPNSELYDRHYYMTAILGLASSGRKGQVYTKRKHISLEDYMALPFKEIYGQDFGTAAPAGLVGMKFDGNNAYAREISYKPMSALDIGIMYCQLNFGDDDLVIADPGGEGHLTIGQLRRGWRESELTPELIEKFPRLLDGFNIRQAIKGPGSINSGISKANSMNIYVVSESKNYWKEIYNYIYAVDKNDKYTGDPIDDFNHLLDPERYVIQGRGRFF